MQSKTRFKRVLVVTILVFFGVITLGEKPKLKISVVASNQVLESVLSSIAFDRVSYTERFTVVLLEALKLLGEELRLQDLFSTEDVVLSKACETENSVGELHVELSLLEVRRYQERNEYVQNNVSGDYILVGGTYKRIQVGARYSYDFEARGYVRDANGFYVRALDGTYHLATTFYSYAPHENEYYIVSWVVLYELSAGSLFKTGRKVFKETYYTKRHYYDPYNGRILKIEKAVDDLIWIIAEETASYLASELSTTYTTSGVIESVKFPRAIISIGRRDGVKEGLHYGVYRNDNLIAELVVRRASGDYSECEVTYIRYGENLQVFDKVVEKSPSKIVPMRLGITFDSKQLFRIHFGSKHLDLHREEVACGEFTLGYQLEQLISYSLAGQILDTPLAETSIGVRIRLLRIADNFSSYLTVHLFGKEFSFTNLRIGLAIKIGVIEGFLFYEPLSESQKIVYGGGLVW